VTEDDAEDLGTTPLAALQYDRGAGAEIDLSFLAGATFETAEGELLSRFELVDEATHTVVTAGETVFGSQILVDALSAEADLQLGLDRGSPRRTVTGSAAW
jgi:hypothetical protein